MPPSRHPRRTRIHGTPLTLTQLEDRSVPSGGNLYPLPPKFDLSSPTGYLTGPQPDKSAATALAVLTRFAPQVGLQPADVAGATLLSGYADSGGGWMTHYYFRQSVNGLPVANSSIGVHFASDNSVITINGQFVQGLGQMAGSLPRTPTLSPVAAVAAAAAYFNYPTNSPPVLVSGGILGPTYDAVVSAPAVSMSNIPVKATYVSNGNSVRLGWGLQTYERGGAHAYNVVVDAQSGAVLLASDWVESAGPASPGGTSGGGGSTLPGGTGGGTVGGGGGVVLPGGGGGGGVSGTASGDAYRVFPLTNSNPTSGSDRSLLVSPADRTASPAGWIGGAATSGNNASGQADPDGTDSGGSVAALPTNLFDFPLDFTAQPQTYTAASVTQLFYDVNALHDLYYKYGFTEAAGNFQQTNFTGQGLGNDAVQADAQDGGGTGNATFYTPPDGIAPRLQTYLWYTTTPARDGAFDSTIIAHEYGHGVSTRLTGGAGNADSLQAPQSAAMGEGWSDWWALMYTMKPGDSGANPAAIGGYAVGGSGGLRSYPYSTDLATDPLTFGNWGGGAGQNTNEYDGGQIWGSALWDMTWNLIGKYGFDENLGNGYSSGGAGNTLALQLVMDAMKLQPANPTFIEARDALLLADRNLTGGQNAQAIWAAFAGRGLGYGATTNGDGVVTPSFAMPPAAANPTVVAQTPAGTVTGAPPTKVTVTFSEPMDPASFNPRDDIVGFTGPGGIDLKPAAIAGGFAWLSPTKLQINFAVPANSATQGRYSLTLAPGILSKDNHSPLDQNFNGVPGETPGDQYAVNFAYDATPLLVTNLTLSTAAGGGGVLSATFSEAVDPRSLGTDDVQVTLGRVVGFTVVSPTQVNYQLAELVPGPLSVQVKRGAVTDAFGFPVRDFTRNFLVGGGPTIPTDILPGVQIVLAAAQVPPPPTGVAALIPPIGTALATAAFAPAFAPPDPFAVPTTPPLISSTTATVPTPPPTGSPAPAGSPAVGSGATTTTTTGVLTTLIPLVLTAAAWGDPLNAPLSIAPR